MKFDTTLHNILDKKTGRKLSGRDGKLVEKLAENSTRGTREKPYALRKWEGPSIKELGKRKFDDVISSYNAQYNESHSPNGARSTFLNTGGLDGRSSLNLDTRGPNTAFANTRLNVIE